MKGIIKAEDDARERLMEDIKSTEVLRNKLEADLTNLFRQIKKLKKDEVNRCLFYSTMISNTI